MEGITRRGIAELKRQGLWQVSILARPEEEETVAALLEEHFATAPVSAHDVESGLTTLSVYLERRPSWSEVQRRRLSAGLARVRACSLEAGRGQIRLARVRVEDWANSWKKHFPPIEIGRALLVRPSWSRRRARCGQAVVVLDPGLSFGTGQHPTTAFCLEQLVAYRRPGRTQSFLDMGMGSGILGIAAAKLGYRPVRGFDYDPDAVRIARANGRRNRVQLQVEFFHQDLLKLSQPSREKFDVVCANLLANLLVSERDRVLARLNESGLLVLAGILTKEFAKVQRAYEAAGCRLVASHREGEWRSGSFTWKEAGRGPSGPRPKGWQTNGAKQTGRA